MTDRQRLRIIEEWTGHRKPRNLPMSFARGFLLTVAAVVLIVALTGCTVETITTRETSAKGHTVETVRKVKKADPAAWALAGDVVAAYSPPRARRIREEKSATPADLRRILRGRPITKQEIANRWKP